MKKLIKETLILYSISFFLSGCADKHESNSFTTPVITEDVGVIETAHFQSHAVDAEKFWRLIEKARKLRVEQRYKQALTLLEEAFESAAFGRIEKAVALVQSAEIYEILGDYKAAASFYEGAAKTTMNEVKAKFYNEKAKKLTGVNTNLKPAASPK